MPPPIEPGNDSAADCRPRCQNMPLIGYGIWKVPKENAADSVYNAIKLGYRHIDGAHDYMNSAEAGQGVRKALEEGIVKREELL